MGAWKEHRGQTWRFRSQASWLLSSPQAGQGSWRPASTFPSRMAR